jgi:hypothetical protein
MPFYGVFAGNVPLQPGDFFLESSADNITATPSGTQTNAFQLTTQTARVATVATIGDAIKLPASLPGMELLVVNHGANSMQVFGAGTDTIDDQATATGVSQMANSMVIYTCATTGKWYTEGLSSGFAASLGLQTFSYATIAANVAGTQVAGTPIKAMLTNVTSAGASYSSTLPASAPGLELTVHNISANTQVVFPATGETINGGGANASINMLTNTSTVFTCVTAGAWFSVPRVPS